MALTQVNLSLTSLATFTEANMESSDYFMYLKTC